MQEKSLFGKTAIITGSSKGIGREIARLLGLAGCRMVITARDQDQLKDTANRLYAEGIQVLSIAGDVRNVADCQKIINQALHSYGRLDILVNNAGMSMRGTVEQTEIEVFRTLMEINFIGSVTMTKLALPHIKETAGSIVFISSVAGLKGLPAVAPYSASKMALNSFFESLRSENINGVHFGIIYPGITENDPNKRMYSASGETISFLPRKVQSTQQDVAEAVLRLIRHRKRQIVMTPLGKLARFAYLLFPGSTEFLLSKFARNTKLYAAEDIFN